LNIKSAENRPIGYMIRIIRADISELEPIKIKPPKNK